MEKLRITERNNKAALWIGDWNVWDLPHKITDNYDVLMAIRHSWELGYRAATEEILHHVASKKWHFASTDIWIDERQSRKGKKT